MAYTITEHLIREVSELHPPDCDCVHELCGEIARALLQAWERIRLLENRQEVSLDAIIGLLGEGQGDG